MADWEKRHQSLAALSLLNASKLHDDDLKTKDISRSSFATKRKRTLMTKVLSSYPMLANTAWECFSPANNLTSYPREYVEKSIPIRQYVSWLMLKQQ